MIIAHKTPTNPPIINADNRYAFDEQPLAVLQSISATIKMGKITKVGTFCVVRLLMPMKYDK
jgi:hypothetical protein